MVRKTDETINRRIVDSFILIICLLMISNLFSFPYQPGWPQEIEGGVDFSSPVLVDVNNDDTLEVLVAGNTQWIYMFNHRGESMPGWPQRTSNNPNVAETSSPAVGDIDNDGEMEIVYASDVGELFAWEVDGSTIEGFPVNLGDNVIRASATLEDVDNNYTLEICIGTGALQYKFFVYRYDGTLLFQKDVEYRVHSTAAVGDMDKDGSMEIIHGVDRNVQYGVYAWESDGSPCSGWPVETGHHVDGSPALADIDNDSTYEIFVGSIDNRVYGWNYLGLDLPSWPNIVGSGVYEGVVSSPAAGDIDDDGLIDIVIGRGIIQSSYGAIFAFRSTGDTLSGFPITITTGSVTSSPALADVDGDEEIEIIVGCQDGKLYAFNPDVSAVTGFPITVCNSITSSPAVGDIDLDGDIEIVVGGKGSGGDDSLYIWDLSVAYDSTKMPWPMFHHDPRHTGRLPLSETQTIEEKGCTDEVETYKIVSTITTGTVLFLPSSQIPFKIRVFDIAGRKIKDSVFPIRQFSLRGLKNGIYFIEFTSFDGKIKGRSKVILITPDVN